MDLSHTNEIEAEAENFKIFWTRIFKFPIFNNNPETRP